MLAFFRTQRPALFTRLEKTGELSDEMREEILAAADVFFAALNK